MSPSDSDLVKTFQENQDNTAFAVLLNRHAAWLSSMVYSLTGGQSEETEDILQEIALAVAQNLHRFRGQASFRTWLFRLGRNKTIDYLRHNRSRRQALASYSSQLQASSSPGADHYALQSLQEQELWQIVRSLPTEDRLLAWLRYAQDQSPKEIAETLGISENALKARLHRLKVRITKRSHQLEEVFP
jgi:RNA polymerase sigma-70 factor (ECF subfamily)